MWYVWAFSTFASDKIVYIRRVRLSNSTVNVAEPNGGSCQLLRFIWRTPSGVERYMDWNHSKFKTQDQVRNTYYFDFLRMSRFSNLWSNKQASRNELILGQRKNQDTVTICVCSQSRNFWESKLKLVRLSRCSSLE